MRPPDVDTDARYMGRALMLARRGLYTTEPNPRVGCVLVRDGEIVGEGWHERAGEPHAEINALRAAGERARGATAYVSLEPCSHHGRTPPCADALIEAGVVRVVAAMQDPNPQVAGQGLERLRVAGIEASSPLMEGEARRINPGFVSRMRRQRPYVRVKLAVSLDGRTAMANGESKWITGEAARRDVQRLRAQSSAILTGVGTVVADDPSLNVRAFDIGRQPLRVVVGANLSTPADARLLSLEGETLIVTASEDADRAEELVNAGAEVLCLSSGVNSVDLHALFAHLAAREINEVLVEAGATTCGGLLAAGLVDELVVYLAPHVMGHQGRGMFFLPGLNEMAQRMQLTIEDVRAVGEDWRITACPRSGAKAGE
ncbi:MAG: bifunctional diaminohydroxyphosphoribosylaminopyrimidine deaminase/5-amino-6-(5-phosphoribosylamino)uracil reductase RibD [Acidiferrobacteraceae bacterium]